ncbi:MAG: O-antigen ligase family protein [Candidatus Hodarchaeota archaeon]
MPNTNRLSPKGISNSFRPDFFASLAALGLLLFPVQFGLQFQGFIYGIQFDFWRICVFLLFYSVLLKCLLTRKPLNISISNLDKWVYIFCGVLIASVFWSLYPSYSARQAVDITINLVFYIALINILPVSRARTKFWNIWLMSTPWINGLLTLFYFIVYGGLRAGSVSGEAINISNLLAVTSIMTIPILWASTNLAGPLLRRINLLGLILAIVIIFFSESRAGMGTGVFIMLGTAWFLARQEIMSFFKVVFITVLIGLVGVILSTSWFATQTYDKIIDRVRGTVFTSSITEARSIGQDIGRAYMYDATKTVLKSYPLSGIGLRSLKPYIEERFNIPKGWIAHGFPIEILTNVGLVGAIPFMILMYLIFRQLSAVRLSSRSKGNSENIYNTVLAISFLGFMLHSLFRPVIIEPYFYTFCAVFSAQLKEPKISHNSLLL